MRSLDPAEPRNVVSPRIYRTQPYVDSRSPFNEKLRHDFYSGQYLDNFDKRKTPVNNPKDPHQYVDRMVGQNPYFEDPNLKK